MPESIVLQVGQCGNQIGSKFWELALQEHAKHNPEGWYDESMGSFFHNQVPKSAIKSSSQPLRKISNLKARALLVDMEEGVINEFKSKSPVASLFDSHQMIHDSSGSGNNWAQGHVYFGDVHKEAILNEIRSEAEKCNSLQSFFMIHSIGGGTGSGLGTRIISLLEDEFPEVFRMTFSVFPSADDDVITSPYNSMLSLNQLIDHADCVFPIENQALFDFCEKIDNQSTKGSTDKSSVITQMGQFKQKRDNFTKMNSIVADVMLNLTCSMRFEGSLNVDLNEIVMNLVPYPRMHFLIPSISPLYQKKDVMAEERRVDAIFTDLFSKDFQLIKADPKNHKYLACALMARGNFTIWDIRRNIDRIRPKLSFVPWNEDGWKIGLCSKPSLNQSRSLLGLSNNTCFHKNLSFIQERFSRLFSKKAHLYHYLDYLDTQDFIDARENCNRLIQEYAAKDFC